MSLTPTEARDEILELFRAAWAAHAGAPQVFYWDTPHDPPRSTPFARVTLRHATGNNDAIGNRLFERMGTVTVQIFTTFGTGLQESDVLSKVAMDAYQGKSTPGGAWFRNVRLNEIGQDGEFFQVQVLADFTYCEVL